MSKILRKILKYTVFLLLVVAPVFFVHTSLLHQGELFLTYGINWALAFLFYVILVLRERQLMPYMGYYFLYFSIFKFGVFLFTLRPLLDLTLGVRSPAFLSFFIPYSICTAFEISYLIKELNKG